MCVQMSGNMSDCDADSLLGSISVKDMIICLSSSSTPSSKSEQCVTSGPAGLSHAIPQVVVRTDADLSEADDEEEEVEQVGEAEHEDTGINTIYSMLRDLSDENLEDAVTFAVGK